MIVRINSNLAKSADSLAAKLKLLEPGGAIYDNIMRAVSLTMLSAVKRRIYLEGRAADGSDIGQYSTRPIYINPKNSPKDFGRPIGKTGSKFKTGEKKGQDHKTRYFPDGYKGFRNSIGRPVNKVNLSLSGQMNAQFVVLVDGSRYFLGWPNGLYGDIAEGQEGHWRKKIFKLTDAELALFGLEFEKQLILALQQ